LNARVARFLRIATRVLATLVVGFPAIWGAFALWYQVPGGHALKTLGVALWAVFSFAMLMAL
jgi:hypothetical protein